MSADKTGGSAFPQIDSDNNADYQVTKVFSAGGMSLRDWFAGMALQGILSNPHTHEAFSKAEAQAKQVKPMLVRTAYEYADMVLAERSK